eukprot:SAG11_NODE_1148_length_5683_cov_73.890561_2_plen_99_part_00
MYFYSRGVLCIVLPGVVGTGVDDCTTNLVPVRSKFSCIVVPNLNYQVIINKVVCLGQLAHAARVTAVRRVKFTVTQRVCGGAVGGGGGGGGGGCNAGP